MNDVLSGLETLLKANMSVSPYIIKRIESGLYTKSYNINIPSDYPAIWIEPLDETMTYSIWSNNLDKLYSIRIYIIMFLRNQEQTQVKTQPAYQGPTLNEYSNEIIRILGTDKTLGGTVTRQLPDFQIENFIDARKRQVKSIKVKFIDDFIPYASQTIDQNDMIKQ